MYQYLHHVLVLGVYFFLRKIVLQTGHGEICDFVHLSLISYRIWQISFTVLYYKIIFLCEMPVTIVELIYLAAANSCKLKF